MIIYWLALVKICVLVELYSVKIKMEHELILLIRYGTSMRARGLFGGV